MSRGAPALVKAALLIWARQSAGMRVEDAARKLELSVEVVASWAQEWAALDYIRRTGEHAAVRSEDRSCTTTPLT